MTKNNRGLTAAIVFAGLTVSGSILFFSFLQTKPPGQKIPSAGVALAAKFDELSQNGNSTCMGSFVDSIKEMESGQHLQGSCCSPMSLHRYIEQVEGLKKYASVPEIPPDPIAI